MPRLLVKWEDYTREEAHDIFSPQSAFSPQSGTWGLQGIVSIPARAGDYVFFVTYGQKQGAHEFDEGITEDGVLTWQSQPKQKLADRQIRELISHNEDINSIYLFLRTDSARAYTYLGRLKYLSHDDEREQPVYFKWQLLEWEISPDVRARMGLTLLPRLGDIPTPAGGPDIRPGQLLTFGVAPPRSSEGEGRGEQTRLFKGRRTADASRREAANRELGLAGERLVLRHEEEQLARDGRADLVPLVRHISIVEGDGAGFDILSFHSDGTPKYIEVKTTTGARDNDFFVSATELAFSELNPNSYYLYRVYSYDAGKNAGECYVIRGPLRKEFTLVPTQFRARR